MPKDIAPTSDETHIALVALIERLEQSILEARACAKASQRINKLRLASAQSPAARAANSADIGVPVGSRVVGSIVCDRLGKGIGRVTSTGGFAPGEPTTPFASPATASRNAKDQAKLDRLFRPFPKAAANIRSLLSEVHGLLYNLSAARKEIENLPLWRMAGAPPSLWVGAAEPHLQDLKTFLSNLVQHTLPAETQTSSVETLLDRISDRSLFNLTKHRLKSKELAAQLRVGEAAFFAYGRQLRGETPARPLAPGTFGRIKAGIQAIALDLAKTDPSFFREVRAAYAEGSMPPKLPGKL